MQTLRRPSWPSVAALLLIGVAMLGVVEHQANAETPAPVESEHVATGHAEPDGTLHFDPAATRPHHCCVVCWTGSKSQVVTTAVRLGVSLIGAAAPVAHVPGISAGWLVSAPSRAPPRA